MKRNSGFLIRLSMEEMQRLDKKVKNTGMSREAYARSVLNGYAPIESPPVEYFDVLRELHAIGNNMHQIAYRANSLQFLDAPYYKKNADRILAVCDALLASYIPVRRM